MLSWDEHYVCLLRFISESNGQTPDITMETTLSTWIKNQKYNLANGKDKTLTKRLERIRLSKKVGVNVGRACERILQENEADDDALVTDEFSSRPDSLPTTSRFQSTKRRTWEENFEALVAFKQREGHCNVPPSYPPDPKLSTFVRNTRQIQRNIAPERRAKLEALGFDFTYVCQAQVREEQWKQMLECFLSYKESFPEDSNICSTKVYQGKRLGHWLYHQRKSYKEGTLKEERRKKLVKAGVSFDKTNVQPKQFTEQRSKNLMEQKWFHQYRKLQDFRKANGHCRISHGIPDRHLVNWTTHQRCLNKRNQLRKDRKELLDKVGFDWHLLAAGGVAGESIRRRLLPDEAWEKKFELFTAFRKEYGHFNIPLTMKELYTWIVHHRAIFRKGQIKHDRADRLIQIGLSPLEQRNDYWDAAYLKVSTQASWDADPKLANWIKLQQVLWKWSWLERKKKEKLDALPFDWNPSGDKNAEYFSVVDSQVDKSPLKGMGLKNDHDSSHKRPVDDTRYQVLESSKKARRISTEPAEEECSNDIYSSEPTSFAPDYVEDAYSVPDTTEWDNYSYSVATTAQRRSHSIEEPFVI